MKRLKSLALVAVAVATFGLVGCSSDKGQQQQAATKVVETVKGEVEIPANPQRIVDISGSSEELAILGHTVVGTANVDSYDTENIPSYMKDQL